MTTYSTSRMRSPIHIFNFLSTSASSTCYSHSETHDQMLPFSRVHRVSTHWRDLRDLKSMYLYNDFAFCVYFLYTVRMRLRVVYMLLLFFPWTTAALWEYVGTSLGTNFYSTIDDGRYSVRTAMIEKYLSEGTDANTFIWECHLGTDPIFQPGTKVDRTMIEELLSGDYDSIHKKLDANFLKSAYNTDIQSRLTQCILKKYDTIRAESDKTIKNIEKVAMIGMYMDGSTQNSDYDIVTDIENINRILFESPTSYNGTENMGRIAFDDILSWNARSLLTGSTFWTGDISTGSLRTWALSSPLFCPPDGFWFESDSWLLDDIAWSLANGNTNGKSTSWWVMASEKHQTSSWGSDYSDIFSCDGDIFCITIRMISGTNEWLSASRPVSIEWIIAKNLDSIEKANATSLTAKYMTNNFFGFTFPFLNLPSLGNIVVMTTEKPQKSYTLAKDVRRDDVLEFDTLWRCARGEAWLDIDETRVNDFTDALYGERVGIDHLDELTTDITPEHTTFPLRQNLTDCTNYWLLKWNTDRYEGLSRDLTEIQVFTDSLTTGLHAVIPGVLSTLMKTPQV